MPGEHIAWPYRLGATVAIDSDDERKQAAACLAATPRGTIPGLPTFGVSTPVFDSQPVDGDLTARQVNDFDPRLDTTGAAILRLTDPQTATVLLGVSPASPGEEA